MDHTLGNRRGAMLMVIGAAAFTLNDTCLKALSAHLPLFQTLFLRGVGNTIILGMLAFAFGQMRFSYSRQDWMLIGIRSLAEAFAAVLFVTALFHMELANATAIMQAMPIVMTVVGALWLKEKVGWRRTMATLVGFIGVLMIVHPGTDNFNIYSLFALATVATVSVRDLAARRMSANVPSIFAAWSAASAVAIVCGAGSIFEDWQPVSGTSVLLLFGAMAFVMTGYIMSVMAVRVGEISFVSPFRYASLLVGITMGYLVFGDLPNGLEFAGCVVVVASGLFILLRERSLEKED